MNFNSCTRTLNSWSDKRRRHLEENLSTKQHLQEENTRFQSPHENEKRTNDPEKKAGQRKKAFDSLTNQPDLRFPRYLRVRSRVDYLKIQRSGRKIRGRYLILLTSKNNLSISRFGITVSRRNGNAVKRNRIRRKIREVQRQNRHRIFPGNDVVIIARQGVSGASYQQIETEYLHLAHQADLLERLERN